VKTLLPQAKIHSAAHSVRGGDGVKADHHEH